MESSNQLIWVIISSLGGGAIVFGLLKYLLTKPKTKILEITKDETEFLYSVRSFVVNLKNSHLYTDYAKIKLFNVEPSKSDNKINSLISSSFLRKKKYYISKIKLSVRSKLENGMFLPNQVIDPHSNNELLISGITTDTRGIYKCAIRLYFRPYFLFIFPIKSNWFKFDYAGEIPPGIIINISTKKRKINKSRKKIINSILTDYIQSNLSIRITKERLVTKQQIELFSKSRGNDIFINLIGSLEKPKLEYSIINNRLMRVDVYFKGTRNSKPNKEKSLSIELQEVLLLTIITHSINCEKLENALEALNQLIRLNDTFSYQLARLVVYNGLNKLVEMTNTINELLDIYQDAGQKADMHHMLGMVYFKKNQKKDTLTEMCKAINLAEKDDFINGKECYKYAIIVWQQFLGIQHKVTIPEIKRVAFYHIEEQKSFEFIKEGFIQFLGNNRN